MMRVRTMREQSARCCLLVDKERACENGSDTSRPPRRPVVVHAVVAMTLAVSVIFTRESLPMVDAFLPAPMQHGTHSLRRPNFGVFGHSRIPDGHLLSTTTALSAKCNGKEQSQNSVNEWGIPCGDDLPPLGPTDMPVPKVLPNGGKVTLLGSGPGDPDLLTVSAYKLLTNCPGALVIADRLVSQEILDLIDDRCEIKTARKLPGCADLAQDEIYYWVHQGLQEGRHVIRLKIGDPFVFGRGGEEVLMFRKYGVESTVVPGVSSAFSAPLLGSIPVTHRGAANQVVMCTGYGREGTSPDLIRYHKEQTIVFLMAVGRLRVLCQRLMDQAGYPGETPVAIVEKAGCPDQRTVSGNMWTIADIAEKHNIQPPSTIIVGDVVNVLLQKDELTGEAVTGLIQNSTSATMFA